MNELALFAGAGGGILGGHLLGWRTICAVEWDAYAASILVHRQNDGSLPPFPVWDDVQTFDGRPWRGRVDVISGGFPCQDISSAGKGAGIDGERSGMWGHMARIVGEVRPRFVFVENSPLLVGRGLARVLGDLASLGYDARWGVLGAHHAGAPHKRDRIWIVGNHRKGKSVEPVDDEASGVPGMEDSEHSGLQGRIRREEKGSREASGIERSGEEVADSDSKRAQDGDTKKRSRELVGADSCSKKRIPDATAIRGEQGWECKKCGHPVCFDFGEGCQLCGSSNVSYPDLKGLEGWTGHESDQYEPGRKPSQAGRSAASEAFRPGQHWWAVEPGLGGVVDGMGNWLDIHGTPEPGSVPRLAEGIRSRVARLKAIGNGQVPQCAALAWRILNEWT